MRFREGSVTIREIRVAAAAFVCLERSYRDSKFYSCHNVHVYGWLSGSLVHVQLIVLYIHVHCSDSGNRCKLFYIDFI